MPPSTCDAAPSLRVLFFVEGFTDIRFVTGLTRICQLTMLVPARQYDASGLRTRVAASGVPVEVVAVPGGRLRFQLRSLVQLWRLAGRADVIVSQELLRGSLNANLIGRLRRVPVVAYMGIAPVEYFRCRRERGQIGAVRAWGGEAAIRALMRVNGWLSTRCLAMGPYLRDVAARVCARSAIGLYYGVDVDRFRPADASERRRLRAQLDLPPDAFLVLCSSRMSHEKDPETVLRAVAALRRRGVPAVVLNLGGGYREFLELAARLDVPDAAHWVSARPAVHPMAELADYFRAADVVALASLAEGAAYSTLEALACETPVVATAVGGMAVQLQGRAWLTPRQDAEAMADAFASIARDPEGARERARDGRGYVRREWSRTRAFRDLARALAEVVGTRGSRDAPTRPGREVWGTGR